MDEKSYKALPQSDNSLCPYCGQDLFGNTLFCPHCGKMLNAKQGQSFANEMPQAPENIEPKADIMPYAPPQQQGRQKSINLRGVVIVGVIFLMGLIFHSCFYELFEKMYFTARLRYSILGNVALPITLSALLLINLIYLVFKKQSFIKPGKSLFKNICVLLLLMLLFIVFENSYKPDLIRLANSDTALKSKAIFLIANYYISMAFDIINMIVINIYAFSKKNTVP